MKTLLGLIFSTMLSAPSNEVTILKVVDFSSKPIVEATLNGKKAYFMLDTGAEISIINLNAENKFGFRTYTTSRSVAMVGFGGRKKQVLQAGRVQLLFGMKQVNTQLYCIDINVLAKAVKAKTGYEIVGIIGSDMMRQYGFVINYNNSSVQMVTKSKNKKIFAVN